MLSSGPHTCPSPSPSSAAGPHAHSGQYTLPPPSRSLGPLGLVQPVPPATRTVPRPHTLSRWARSPRPGVGYSVALGRGEVARPKQARRGRKHHGSAARNQQSPAAPRRVSGAVGAAGNIWEERPRPDLGPARPVRPDWSKRGAGWEGGGDGAERGGRWGCQNREGARQSGMSVPMKNE